MSNFIFVFGLALLLCGFYIWGFRHLSEERWQFIGAIPVAKNRKGQWHGLNLTYYGLLNASACTLSVLIVYILLASIGLPLWFVHMTLAVALIPCIPAAKLVARWVEKKAHTFSIGGAAFVGFMLTPWSIMLLKAFSAKWAGFTPPVMPILAVIAIAYAIGEGCGRLACISFGCCYGRPLADFSPSMRRLLLPFSMSYQGATKKIAYADGNGNGKVVAVQAMTAVLHTLAGLIGMGLFLQGKGHAAYLLCVSVTQIWRFLSEFLRADYRGAGSISAYQIMALVTVGYALGLFVLMPEVPHLPQLIAGLHLLWNPSIIILCQILWIGIFLYMGRSQVTGSRITFHVRQDRI
jgi:hypothetical protein